MAKVTFDDLIKEKDDVGALRYFAREYYDTGRIGGTRKRLLSRVADKLKRIDGSCDYCSLVLKSNGDIESGKLIYCSDFSSVSIHKNSRTSLLIECDDFESHVKIKYCPMCGGKLND